MVENGQQRRKCWNCCCCSGCFKTKRDTEEKYAEEEERPKETAMEFPQDLQAQPYVGELPNLKVGQLLCVTGYVNKTCRRFSINFLCGQETNCDIAFHFNPRMEQRYIVRNCRVRGRWGDEETASVTAFDFAVGKRFKVDFLVAEREFMVSVNGRHWCAFTYRVPLERVRGVEIRGKVDIQEVALVDVDTYPIIPEPAILIELNDDARLKSPCMPYIGKLSKPLAPGWSIEITGRLKMLPQSFYINLQDGVQIWPHPTIPLHLNPRFCTTAGIDVFVRNAWLDGNWGQEERAPIFPFLPGNDFKLSIQSEMDCFTVWISDQMVALFKFRGSIDAVRYVYINGDLTVYGVTLRDKMIKGNLPLV